MIMWRLVKWFAVLVILVVLFVGFGLPLMANTQQGREQLAEIFGESVDRKVEIGGLEVGWFFSSLDVKGLRIDNPAGFPEGAFLEAGRLKFDSQLKNLLQGKVEGGLTGRGLKVHLIRKGGKTNLDGLAGGDGEDEDAGQAPDLDLKISLGDSRLQIDDLDKGESLVLDGVGLEMRLTNHAGKADSQVTIRVHSIDRNGIAVRDLVLDARQAGDWLDLKRLSAGFAGGGALQGSGRMQVRGGDGWALHLDASRVGIDRDMLPVVAALLPFASAAGGQVQGTLNAKFDLEGHGLTWKAMRPTLAGTGSVTLSGLGLPADSLLAQAAALAGRGRGGLSLDTAGARFKVGEGRIEFERLVASGEKVQYELAGRVYLDGRLDLSMDLMPLVKTFGGGKRYARLSKHIDKIPLGIGGTTLAPRLEPADLAKSIARGAIEKGLGKALGRLGKR